MQDGIVFESCVNPEGYKARAKTFPGIARFESCVNPEGYKADFPNAYKYIPFESCVNPEGYKAVQNGRLSIHCLRAV